MRVIALWLCLVFATGTAAAAPTVWNVKVPGRDGEQAKLTFIDSNPNDLLPACRCVLGTWRLGGESTTHFEGTLVVQSKNHARKAVKRIGARVRKTRTLMGVQKEYREPLHAIMRGSGQVILREVQGGEWEVAAFAHEPIADLFARYPNWRAQRASFGKPTPMPDAAADAVALAKLINDYRASIALPRIPISPAMTKVAQAHVRDLNESSPLREGCNMHSWSDKGSWTSCCYDSSKAAARCMWRKPKEIAGYPGEGYEIAARASGITADHALELWQGSPAHHAVLINQNQWTKPWGAMGVAIEGDYAVAWFGEQPDKKRR